MWPPDTSSTTSGQLEVRILEERRVEVGLEVVHPDERHVPHERQRLGRAHADEQRADQTRADGGGDGVDAGVLDAGLDDGLGDDRHDQLDVGAAGDLGHDAAEAGVQIDLARHHRRQHVGAADHDGRRRLVARRLDAEDDRVAADVADLTTSRSSTSSASSSRRSCRGWPPRSASSRSAYSGVSMSLAHMTMASSFVSS